MCPTRNIPENYLSSSLEVSAASDEDSGKEYANANDRNQRNIASIDHFFLRPWGLLLDLGDWLPQLLCRLLLHGGASYFYTILL